MENVPPIPPEVPYCLIGDALGQQVFLSLRRFHAPPLYAHELSADAQARLDRAEAWLSSRLTPEEIDIVIPD